ncbi:hypothetical protein CesoFtcFv8_016258 [Champsocephalus esox]|nr:hypothetical protein CesoFtcFv8_016258 [Champsocephalus esox]
MPPQSKRSRQEPFCPLFGGPLLQRVHQARFPRQKSTSSNISACRRSSKVSRLINKTSSVHKAALGGPAGPGLEAGVRKIMGPIDKVSDEKT